MKELTWQPNQPYFWALTISPFCILTWKPTISKFLHTKWQQYWNNNIHNKLFQIQPTLEEWRPVFRKSRREQLHIGQQGLLTLSYWNRNYNHCVWSVRQLAPLDTFLWDVEFSLSSDSNFSKWIVHSICLRTSK